MRLRRAAAALPYYVVISSDGQGIRVQAEQPIDTSRLHPFIDAVNKEFNMFLFVPRPGRVPVVCTWQIRQLSARYSKQTKTCITYGVSSPFSADEERCPMTTTTSSGLELDDIQSGVLRPRPAPYVATYIALRIDDLKAGQHLMQKVAGVVASAANPPELMQIPGSALR
jgi:hypothetical protein